MFSCFFSLLSLFFLFFLSFFVYISVFFFVCIIFVCVSACLSHLCPHSILFALRSSLPRFYFPSLPLLHRSTLPVPSDSPPLPSSAWLLPSGIDKEWSPYVSHKGRNTRGDHSQSKNSTISQGGGKERGEWREGVEVV